MPCYLPTSLARPLPSWHLPHHLPFHQLYHRSQHRHLLNRKTSLCCHQTLKMITTKTSKTSWIRRHQVSFNRHLRQARARLPGKAPPVAVLAILKLRRLQLAKAGLQITRNNWRLVKVPLTEGKTTELDQISRSGRRRLQQQQLSLTTSQTSAPTVNSSQASCHSLQRLSAICKVICELSTRRDLARTGPCSRRRWIARCRLLRTQGLGKQSRARLAEILSAASGFFKSNARQTGLSTSTRCVS